MQKVVRVSGRKCPICKSFATYDFVPFCSERCANIDLGMWLGEAYYIEQDDNIDEEMADQGNAIKIENSN